MSADSPTNSPESASGATYCRRADEEAGPGQPFGWRELRIPGDPEVEQPRPLRARVVDDVLGLESR